VKTLPKDMRQLDYLDKLIDYIVDEDTNQLFPEFQLFFIELVNLVKVIFQTQPISILTLIDNQVLQKLLEINQKAKIEKSFIPSL
jgi:hypothetical protein